MNRFRILQILPWITFLALAMIISACTGPASTPGTTSDYWETGYNHSSSQADDMPLSYSPDSDGHDYTGSIASNDASGDWYRLDLTQSGQLSVTLTCVDLASNDSIYITLYDSGINEIDAWSLSGTQGGSVTVNSAQWAYPGEYFVRISADSWTHRYDLDPSFTVNGGSYEYWEVESNDSRSQADVMALSYSPGSDGYDFTGSISSSDNSDDWFLLTTTRSGELSIALTCLDLAYNDHIYITLYDSELYEIDAQTLSGLPGGSVTVYSAAWDYPGDYYVRISADSWTHRYELNPDFKY